MRFRIPGIALERFLHRLARGGGPAPHHLRPRDREPRLDELRVGPRRLPVVRDRPFETSAHHLEVAAHEEGIRGRPRRVDRGKSGARLGLAALLDVESREVLVEQGRAGVHLEPAAIRRERGRNVAHSPRREAEVRPDGAAPRAELHRETEFPERLGILASPEMLDARVAREDGGDLEIVEGMSCPMAAFDP